MHGGRDAANVVRLMGGQARTSEILEQVRIAALREAVAAGSLTRVRKGLYALPGLPNAWQTAQRLDGLLSHESAAAHRKWALVAAPATVHVTVPPNSARRPEPGVTFHYADVEEQVGRPGVTTSLRTVLDCAATMPFVEALAVADSATRSGLAPQRLVSAAEARKGRGRRRMGRIAELADPRAANPFESALRAVVLEAGLTGFVPQYPITVGATTYRVDLADPTRRLILEADSHAHHSDRAAFRRDIRRYDELQRAGWLVLRFAWEDVMFDRAWVATLVRDLSAARSVLEEKVGVGLQISLVSGPSPR